MKHLCRRRRKPPVTLLGLVWWPVGGVVCRGLVVLLLLRVFNFLIFKWEKMARRERGLREPGLGGIAGLPC